jgi:ABC-type cobalt transport system substrate-binding protein
VEGEDNSLLDVLTNNDSQMPIVHSLWNRSHGEIERALATITKGKATSSGCFLGSAARK